MSIIGKILPVFIGWCIWMSTGNIIFAAILAVVLETIMVPLFNSLAVATTAKQTVTPLDPFPENNPRGVRVFIAKETKCPETPEAIALKMQEKLQENKKFVYLMNQISEEKLPVQRSFWECSSTTHAKQVKAMIAWRSMGDIDRFIGKNVNDDYCFEAKSEKGDCAAIFFFSTDLRLIQDSEPEQKTETAVTV